MKKAFKKKFDYASPEKYRLFLKKQLLNLAPRYYSVVSEHEIETTDGTMVAVRIVYDQIENPNYELIAEVWINDEYIYLWRDQCWTIAVDKDNQRICQMQSTSTKMMHGSSKFTVAPEPCHKTMVIHQIGHEPIT